MASTSTSPNAAPQFFLRLEDLEVPGAPCDFPLTASAGRHGAGLRLAHEGAVHENHRYRVSLLSSVPLQRGAVYLSVNDQDARPWPIALASHSGNREGAPTHCYQLSSPHDDFLFRMSFGFAAVGVEVRLATGEFLSLSTRDIVCACDNVHQKRAVSSILESLVEGGEGDAAASAAMGWMLSAQSHDLPARAAALVESPAVVDGSRSLRAFLCLCEETLRVYDRNMSYFRTRAHSRVLKREEVVGAQAVRRFGRSELQWLARSPEALYPTKGQTPIQLGGTCYMAQRVQTQRSFRSFDNRENRAVRAFLAQVAVSLGATADAAQEQVGELEEAASRLRALGGESDQLLSLMVVEACLEKERPLVERAAHLRRRALRLLRGLDDAFPQVAQVRYRLPKRTKVFQEINSYAQVHACMRRWESFGSFQMLRDGLVLHTWRMDKLYEYYVLHCLLTQLAAAGFKPDASCAEPLSCARYQLDAYFYANEEQVATVYRLARGAQTLTVYYQPVIYGDAREENGIDLHRTTQAPSANGPRDSYWTPDYLLVSKRGDQVRRVVLDAKFRPFRAVAGEGGSMDPSSAFVDCLLKYRAGMRGPQGCSIDALWLLCGREEQKSLLAYQTSAWATREGLVSDGVATLAPHADALPELLDLLGFVDPVR